MKRSAIRMAAAHTGAVLLGVALAVWWPDGIGNGCADRVLAPGGSAAVERVAGSGGRKREARASLSAEYEKAWWKLMRQPRNGLEAHRRLLRAWADVDPDAALAAALDADMREGNTEGGHLRAFDVWIERRPLEFLGLVKELKFGLMTGRARKYWMRMVGERDPGLLADHLLELGTKDRGTALGICFTNPDFTDASRDALVKALSSLPESAANRKLWSDLGVFVARQSADELLRQYAGSGDAGTRHVIGSALAAQIVAVRDDCVSIHDRMDAIPADLRKQVVENILANPKQNPVAMTLALDETINTDAWARRQKELCYQFHNSIQSGANPEDLASWAATLPEREDCEDLYRVGVRSFILSSPEKAWAAIGEMPSGWKRDNMLTEYVQRALYGKGGVAEATRALERIESDHFRAQADAMIQKRQSQR